MGDAPRDSKAGPSKAAPKKPAPSRPSVGVAAEAGTTETGASVTVARRVSTDVARRVSTEQGRPALPERSPPDVPHSTEGKVAPAGQPQVPSNYYALLKEKYEQEQAEKRLLEQKLAEQESEQPTEDAAPPPPGDEPPPPPDTTSFQSIIASHRAKNVKEVVKPLNTHAHFRRESEAPPAPPEPDEEEIEVSVVRKPSKQAADDNQPIYRDLERGELVVKIFKGRDFKARKSQCRLRLEFDEAFQQQTRVLEGSNPGFMQEFTISKKDWPFSSRMHLEVWDMGLIKNFVASLPFEWPPFDPGYTKATYPLLQKGKNVGNLEVCVIDTAICSSKGQIEALTANTALYGMDQYDGKGLLGEGGGGVVRMIVRKIDQMRFAVKVITKKSEVEARTEIEIMSMINHPHCIRLTEMIEMKSNLYLIMPFMAGGSLGERQLTRHGHRFSENESRRYVQEIAAGLVYLHSQGIVHRDIKPENLMFTGPEKSASIKICDFGLATYKKQVMEEGCGTAPFLAPEIVRQQSYGKEVDLWALGVVVYFMMAGHLPFAQTNQKLLFHAIKSHDFKMPTEFSAEAKHLIQSLMDPDAQRRLTADEVLAHPFVLNVGLDSFMERKPEENEVAVPSRPESALVPKARDLFDPSEDDDAVSLFKKAKAQNKAAAKAGMPTKAAPRVRANSPPPRDSDAPPPLPRQISLDTQDTEPPPPPPED